MNEKILLPEVDDITYFKNELEKAKKINDQKRIRRCINMINQLEESLEIIKLYQPPR